MENAPPQATNAGLGGKPFRWAASRLCTIYCWLCETGRCWEEAGLFSSSVWSPGPTVAGQRNRAPAGKGQFRLVHGQGEQPVSGRRAGNAAAGVQAYRWIPRAHAGPDFHHPDYAIGPLRVCAACLRRWFEITSGYKARSFSSRACRPGSPHIFLRYADAASGCARGPVRRRHLQAIRTLDSLPARALAVFPFTLMLPWLVTSRQRGVGPGTGAAALHEPGDQGATRSSDGRAVPAGAFVPRALA